MSDEQEEELAAIAAIFPELSCDGNQAELDIAVSPSEPALIRFVPGMEESSEEYLQSDAQHAHIEHDVLLEHLPPLHLTIQLPSEYPAMAPPSVSISTPHNWLPQLAIQRLEDEATSLWEALGRSQMIFAYIDYLQQAAEESLNLCDDGCLNLSNDLEAALVQYDLNTKQSIFESGTFTCGVCLEPKRGVVCYRLQHCAHVFCKSCLQDFYENAIKGGDVNTIRCLDPDCGRQSKTHRRLLHPRELLAMGLEESSVRRMVEMKRKKKREADKMTVYCPRSWCQAPARNVKYPPIPADLNDYVDVSDEDEQNAAAKRKEGNNDPAADQRLVVCEKCNFAFCRTCCASWHGSFVHCYPRDSTELSAEEQASYDYIRKNTSPCPTCNSPTQKTMGCNHMHCFQCSTHFCYLCGAWLDGDNPYWHFNTEGTPCYQRLWELEEGDEGQAPGDGRGFAGPRAWEALALEAAENADREEEQAATEARREAPVLMQAQPLLQPADQAMNAVHVLMREDRVHVRRPPGRRRWPGPARPPADGAAVAVRAHERQARRGAQVQAEQPTDEEDELRRFIELALRDEEDGWDSDELADDDEAWRIR